MRTTILRGKTCGLSGNPTVGMCAGAERLAQRSGAEGSAAPAWKATV